MSVLKFYTETTGLDPKLVLMLVLVVGVTLTVGAVAAIEYFSPSARSDRKMAAQNRALRRRIDRDNQRYADRLAHDLDERRRALARDIEERQGRYRAAFPFSA